MWIKSQDGEILIDTNQTSHFYITTPGESLMARTDNESIEIGVYASEEETKAILDKIINALVLGCVYYQMPQKGVVKQ